VYDGVNKAASYVGGNQYKNGKDAVSRMRTNRCDHLNGDRLNIMKKYHEDYINELRETANKEEREFLLATKPGTPEFTAGLDALKEEADGKEAQALRNYGSMFQSLLYCTAVMDHHKDSKDTEKE
jgi:hypothetical protein